MLSTKKKIGIIICFRYHPIQGTMIQRYKVKLLQVFFIARFIIFFKSSRQIFLRFKGGRNENIWEVREVTLHFSFH